MRCSLLLLLLVVPGGTLDAETTRETAARLGADVVLLHGGREARGSIVRRGEDGEVTIAVRRGWLQSRQPEWLAELDQAAVDGRAAAQQALIDRTGRWLEERGDEPKLAPVLRIELERIEKGATKAPDVEPPGETAFVLVVIPADQVRRVFEQPAERKQVALVAWDQQLENVESTAVHRLRAALEQRKVDWRQARVDLSGRLTASAADGEREWAARRAVFEFTYGPQVELQGTGDFVVRTGTDAAAPAGIDLLAGVLQGGLNADVGGLLQGVVDPAVQTGQGAGWLEQASRIAEREGVRGFRVTRSEQNVLQRMVSVEDRFVAQMPDGTWESIFVVRESRDGSVERKDLEARIRADGQVSSALQFVEGLGLGGQIDTAVRFGAATMEAQQAAGGRFAEFTDRYSQRLDAPVLTWDASAK